MSREMFIWDTTGPLHASRCDHLDWLLDAAGKDRRHVVPPKVAEELADKGWPVSSPQLEVIPDRCALGLLRWSFEAGGYPRWYEEHREELA